VKLPVLQLGLTDRNKLEVMLSEFFRVQTDALVLHMVILIARVIAKIS
jgi:hypothetical protein